MVITTKGRARPCATKRSNNRGGVKAASTETENPRAAALDKDVKQLQKWQSFPECSLGPERECAIAAPLLGPLAAVGSPPAVITRLTPWCRRGPLAWITVSASDMGFQEAVLFLSLPIDGMGHSVSLRACRSSFKRAAARARGSYPSSPDFLESVSMGR